MGDRCPVCFETFPESASDTHVLPCCRNRICRFCIRRWMELSNSCPLCKGVIEDPTAALETSLEELDGILLQAVSRLTKIESIAGHIADTHDRSSHIRECMGDVCERAMRVGLFGQPRQPEGALIGFIGIQGVQQALARDVISFIVASYMHTVDENRNEPAQESDDLEPWREDRVEAD
jgi:enamine deaminase RidA (YjgF/YER057c/UK114 family)